MSRLLILKTAALGDVLRTTSILPGLAARYPGAEVTWVTAPGAVPLVAHHPLVSCVEPLDVEDERQAAELGRRLAAERWLRVLSFDDEEPVCRIASAVPADSLSGAHVEPDGALAYTDDTAPWFEMGLISRFGKERADELKIANTRSHPAIYASMLGIEMGRPELPLDERTLARAASFARESGLRAPGPDAAGSDERGPDGPGSDARRPVIGLNTGAGGRWRTKGLPEERVVELARLLGTALDEAPAFLVLGGPDEAERNARLTADLAAAGHFAVDGGADNALLDFAARVGLCDLLVTSDSMALHMGIARSVPIVAFFAPTSAAEIELYGLGEKVASTAPDYCSYRPDADNSTVTAGRLAEASLRVLARSDWRARDRSGK